MPSAERLRMHARSSATPIDKGEDIRTRIERLRGLRPPLKEVPAYDERKLRARALTREGIELALARQAQREAMDRA